jgi:outer membrane protein OmpA-like peptidoglycan-associated protein
LQVVKVNAGQHFKIRVSKKAGTAEVDTGVVKLFKGDEVTQSPFFQANATAGELARIAAINPSPLLFAKNAAGIAAADQPKLEFLATYLKRINTPKFDIKIVGHSSTTGNVPFSQKLSERRAKAVERALKGGGLTNHNLIVSGVGETGAAKTPAWRKVTITPSIVAGYVNAFDTIPHEFGHMIGLGDEYKTPTAKAKATHYNLVKKAFGKQFADLVALRGKANPTQGQSANIMDVGQDVRVYDYVTFWSGLAEATMKAPVPVPPFDYNDWKLIG